MRPKLWLLIFAAALALGLGLVCVSDYVFDIYGLFRNDRGRSLPAWGDQRIAKYLLASRYVPANFNGLLLGPSITNNWKAGRIRGFRVYNASLNGANIVEEKAVADVALASGAMRFAVLLIHPSLTLSHDFQTAAMTPRQRWSALGSQSLLDAYKDEFYENTNQRELTRDGSGAESFGDERHGLNEINIRLMLPGMDFEVDPVALKAYRDLLQELKRYQVQTVLVVPPLAEDLFARKREEFAKYTRLILSQAPSRMDVVDFTAPQYTDFREHPSNFTDGIHLTSKGADWATDQVSKHVGHSLPTEIPVSRALPIQ